MLEWRSALAWIESSALGNAIRDSGVWAYGLINLVHILGIATLFGSILVLDLRLLGWHSKTPLGSIASITVPIAAIGFALAVSSGVCLLSVNATEYAGNPFLLLKFAAIGLGLINVAALSRLIGWRARNERDPLRGEQIPLAICGGISLVCWLAAVGAGRIVGYW
jgi:hypothetical protein